MPDLSVAEAARIIGVSRARVYQRITGNAGGWDAGRPIPALIKESQSRGVKNGRQLRLDLQIALDWRRERETAGLAVGPVPETYQDYVVPVPPEVPPVIGLPSVVPF